MKDLYGTLNMQFASLMFKCDTCQKICENKCETPKDKANLSGCVGMSIARAFKNVAGKEEGETKRNLSFVAIPPMRGVMLMEDSNLSHTQKKKKETTIHKENSIYIRCFNHLHVPPLLSMGLSKALKKSRLGNITIFRCDMRPYYALLSLPFISL